MRAGTGGSRGSARAAAALIDAFMQLPRPAQIGTLASAAGLGIVAAFVTADDMEKREPITEAIAAVSLENCLNATANAAFYDAELRPTLNRAWSTALAELEAEGTPIVCLDKDLKNMSFSYDYREDGILRKRHWGELRAVGILYTGQHGSQAFVMKSKSDKVADHSLDRNPDSVISMGEILRKLKSMPEDTARLDLDNGIKASILIQRDGLEKSWTDENDYTDDEAFWADNKILLKIDRDYEFQWPLNDNSVHVADSNVTLGIN